MVDDHSTKAMEGREGQIFRAIAARSKCLSIRRTQDEERLGLSPEPWAEWYWTERPSMDKELGEATGISGTHGDQGSLKKCK